MVDKSNNFLQICPKCEPEGLAEQNYPVYIPGVKQVYQAFIQTKQECYFLVVTCLTPSQGNGDGLSGEVSYSTIQSVHTGTVGLDAGALGRLPIIFHFQALAFASIISRTILKITKYCRIY